MNHKPSFTTSLKALLLGGALALTATHSAKAVQSAPDTKKSNSPDERTAKIREALKQGGSEAIASGPITAPGGAGLMWWRNAWGNGGGWHNWGNGWHNFRPGGWGNWHNW